MKRSARRARARAQAAAAESQPAPSTEASTESQISTEPQASLPGLELPRHETRVLRITPDKVLETLPLYEKWITKANQYDSVDFVAMATSGDAELWTFWEKDLSACLGVILTQPWQLKSGEAFCQIIGIGGIGIHRWIHLLSDVEAHAVNTYGAKRIRYWSDREAMKSITPEGYRQVAVCLEKELS